MTQSPNNGQGVKPPSAHDLHNALENHRGWLRAVVTARLGEAQAVDDVMQEVALAVVGQRKPLLDGAKIGPWLYQVAIRQTLLYRRKVGRRRKLIANYAQRVARQDARTTERDPLEWLLSRERAVDIRRTFDGMANRDREILMLKYGQDWSYKQIAEHLGISESAVEARLHRARLRLRKSLYEMSVLES